MSFLTPAFLALAALAIPILILYMLRLRRREVPVSSTMLWREVLRDREANAPWQRLKRNLLLLLQLLLLALLVFALARPALRVRAVVRGNVVVLLDASASMAAMDGGAMPGGKSRFEAAKEQARQLVDELGQGATMTLIAVERLPRVIAAGTAEAAVLRRALDGVEVSQAEADWEAAWSLAAAALGPAAGAQRGTLVVISDGGLPATLPGLPVPIRFLPMGEGIENRAIAALAVRDGPHGPQAFAQVANYGAGTAAPLLELYADGVLIDARGVSVPGAMADGSGEFTANLTWQELPPEFTWLHGRLFHDETDPPDLLAADDAAWAIRGDRPAARVLLVTSGNLFLERVLASLPGVEAYRATAEAEGATEAFALTVYDGVLPEAWPGGNLWIINPPHSTDLFDVTGVFSDTALVRTAVDDPILRYVDLGGLHIARAQQVTAFGGARVLAEAEGGPLLLVGETGGRRVAILSFDLHDSDLPLQIAFPVLVANLIGWLLPQQALDIPATLSPGDLLTLHPAPEAETVTVETPDGATHELPLAGGAVTFAGTGVPGLYTVRQRLSDGRQESARFAVNLFSPTESDLVPRETLWVGGEPLAAAAQEGEGQRELWALVAAAACLVLLAEWWVYWRGAG